MKYLQLIPDTHRQQPILWANFAIHLLEQGVSLKHIQTLLGHNSQKLRNTIPKFQHKKLEILATL